MCGIVGVLNFSSLDQDKEIYRKNVAIHIFTELLQLTEERGKDATGVATLFDSGDYIIQKMGIKSTEFIHRFGGSNEDYEGFTKLCVDHDRPIKVMLGHCRKSSVGKPYDNVNNHPIKAGEIIGIHNGTLKNHEIIFEKLKCKRDGVVDSEAIFRLMQEFTKDCTEPFTLDMLGEVTRRLDGTYSCLAVNANNPFQVAMFRDGRPMEMVIVKPLNMMLVASETIFLKKALNSFNRFCKFYTNDYEYIKQEDIVSGSLSNYYVGLVDLTDDISDSNYIKDVVDSSDTFNLQDIWKKTYGYNSYYGTTGNYTNKSSNTAADKKAITTYTTNKDKSETTTNKSNTSTTSTKSNKTETTNQTSIFKGKVYIQDLYKYVTPDEVKEADKLGAITLSSKTNKVESFNDDNDVPFELDTTGIESKNTRKQTTKVKVDVATEPTIIEAAKEYKDTLLKYESDKDLAEEIEAKDVESVNALPAFALANRIRKHVYEDAFIAGANYYRNTFTNEDKKVKAEKLIRVAKQLITAMSIMIENSTEVMLLENNLLMGLAAVEPSEINSETFNSLFSEGDLKNNSILELIKNILDECENNNEDDKNETTSVSVGVNG